MFGYIKPDVRELKVKEHELYKSAYCGLCRTMGKRYSFLYKMSLSYDFVFMVLLRLYALPEKVSFSKKRCIAHPTVKKPMMDENDALRIASDVGVIMLYHDFEDKIKDKDGFKSILAKLFFPEIKRLRKKACRSSEALAEFDRIAKEKINALSLLEKSNIDSIDQPAEQFGTLLAHALSIEMTGNIQRTVFEIGRSIGRWIYIIDALDDIDDDEKNKKYNPFLAVYKTADEAKKHGESLSTALLAELNRAYNALVLLDLNDKSIYNILDNIIRIGNINTHEGILKKNNFLLETNDNHPQKQE